MFNYYLLPIFSDLFKLFIYFQQPKNIKRGYIDKLLTL